ncbi:hypothetical protein C8R45DRAFT_594650 [Mycena sanguinolenta]|nr:hypothetical protein C8R45DRAFT_594650 [Mycena sanguinolenta]
MIQTPDGRSLLCAALCICFAQTFIDGSAKALGFAAAFAAALDAYVGSSTEATVVAEIRKMPDSTHPPRPAAVVAEIRKITDSTEPPHPPQPASPLVPERTNTSTSSWLPQPAWSKKWKDQKRKEREERDRKWREQREEREREERQKQAIIDIVKTHRLRFHEDRKAQMGKANLP